jgi:hypothetical protein
MSLKAVEIDPFLLAELYRQPVIPRMDSRQPEHPEVRPLPFLGKNLRQVLLVVKNPDQAFVSEKIFTMLSKLLNACGLTMEDVALVNVAHLQEREPERLRQQFNPHKVIMFGTLLPGLPENQPRNTPWNEGGMELLYTDTLEAMDQTAELKMPFWIALKRFFNLN